MKGDRVDILDGYSGALYLLAKEVEREGIEDINPKIIFGSADLIDPVSRRYMEHVFKAPYYDQYGCAEVDRTAWQCPEQVGYHMDVDSVITQFVDGEGKDVSAGERGEIVFTSLFNYAMPFIRYSVGDIGIPSDDVCSCGRSLPLMDITEGRKDSFLTLPDGRVISPRTLTVGMSMFEHYDDIDQFRIIQKRKDYFDFIISVKNENMSIENFITKLKNHFSKIFGLSSQNIIMNVHFVDQIPLGKTGRLMAVISEI
jgi:phenylacetate-CoA ligase